MAKAQSALRLQDDLMQAAKVNGERFHRSTADHVKRWIKFFNSPIIFSGDVICFLLIA